MQETDLEEKIYPLPAPSTYTCIPKYSACVFGVRGWGIPFHILTNKSFIYHDVTCRKKGFRCGQGGPNKWMTGELCSHRFLPVARCAGPWPSAAALSPAPGASHLVGKTDPEKEHGKHVCLGPAWEWLQTHPCRLLTLLYKHEDEWGNHRARQTPGCILPMNIIMALTLCCWWLFRNTTQQGFCQARENLVNSEEDELFNRFINNLPYEL